ncbi:photosystem reaction center subunit H [Leptolyngbya iicbica]|uniref:Photosystem reaction center subunit H n=2 Tax=Cyanophyceae TaxID=3028117 RepID=A0A4Q7E8J7_9CYAN|nr:photosystem reaction center subunit H [Leptolyngbya sp. LK]RZM79510.1 photosystem reaction center subunit H [Leptolyngbya sp. LK]
MLNVVRCSQVWGLVAIDGATIAHLGEIEDVWLDANGKVAYLSASTGYVPLAQVADVSPQALTTYGRLGVEAPTNLRRFDRMAVQSTAGDPVGWVEDFLFDWQTGEIAAYLVAGRIAEPWGETVVLSPEDVETITIGYLRLTEAAPTHLKSASTGLQGYLSEKSLSVRQLVKEMSDRLHQRIAPYDLPDTVRLKVQTVSDELAATGAHDQRALQEATGYLQAQWRHLQQNICRSGQRAKTAVDAAWQHLTGKP